VHPIEALSGKWDPDKVASIAQDLIFASTVDGDLHALDAFTGERRWTFSGHAGMRHPASQQLTLV
jgi:outer membrane protein assembly factor BamB